MHYLLLPSQSSLFLVDNPTLNDHRRRRNRSDRPATLGVQQQDVPGTSSAAATSSAVASGSQTDPGEWKSKKAHFRPERKEK